MDQQTSCVHRGNTFFGTFDLVGEADDAIVRVRYNGDERHARLEGFPPEIVANLVLRDLVRLERAQALSLEAGGSRRRETLPALRPESHRLLDL